MAEKKHTMVCRVIYSSHRYILGSDVAIRSGKARLQAIYHRQPKAVDSWSFWYREIDTEQLSDAHLYPSEVQEAQVSTTGIFASSILINKMSRADIDYLAKVTFHKKQSLFHTTF